MAAVYAEQGDAVIRREFKSSKLVLCPIAEHLEHTLFLMAIGNAGHDGAARLARLALDRYFERVEEMLV